VRLHHPEYLQAVFPVRLIARRTQGGRWRGGDQLQIGRRLRRQIDKVLIDDAANAMDRAIEFFNPLEFAGFQDRAGQRLVDDRGRTAALGYEDSGQGKPPGAAREGLLPLWRLRAPERKWRQGLWGRSVRALNRGKGRFRAG
jgi:hypothetical protein